MKSTNRFLSTFWGRVIPVVAMLICIGLSSTQAQNYKPFDEAVASVNAALDNLQGDKNGGASISSTPTQTNKMQAAPASSQVKAFEASYFARFIDQAKMTQSIPEAVQALDAEFNVQGQPSRTSTIAAARLELMGLITY